MRLLALASVVIATAITGRHAQMMDMTPIVNGIEVSCDADRMRIYVDSASPFRGRVYPKGFFKQSECVTSFDGSQDVTIVDLEFNSIDQCGMIMEQGDSQTTFGSVVVVQPHSKLVTMMSRAFQVRCTYDYRGSRLTESGFTGVVSDGFNVSMLGTVWEDGIPGLSLRVLEDGVSPVNATAAPPSATMSIYLTDSNLEADRVNIGDLLEMRVTLAGERAAQMYGIYVRSCTVSDGMGMDSQMLIDDDGCPVEPGVFPHFSYNEHYTQALALYKSHKFPYSSQVSYVCYVDFCLKMNGGCDDFRDRAATLEAGACPRGEDGRGSRSSRIVEGDVAVEAEAVQSGLIGGIQLRPVVVVDPADGTIAVDSEPDKITEHNTPQDRHARAYNIQRHFGQAAHQANIQAVGASHHRTKRQAPVAPQRQLPVQPAATTPSSFPLPESMSLQRALIVVDEAELIDRTPRVDSRLAAAAQSGLSCMSGTTMTGMIVLVVALALITLFAMVMLVWVVTRRPATPAAFPALPPAYQVQMHGGKV